MAQSLAGFAFWLFVGLTLPSAVVLVVCLVALPLAFSQKMRPLIGVIWFSSSFLFAAATWLLSSVVSLAAYGLVAVLIGWLVFGIGVVPIAIFAAFAEFENPALGATLLVMVVATAATRFGGASLSQARR